MSIRKNISDFIIKCQKNKDAIKETLNIFFMRRLYPFLKFMAPLWTWLVTRYVSLYKRFAYKNGVHSPVRGANTICGLIVGTILSLYVNLWYILPTAGTIAYDIVAYNVFDYKTEKMYFSSPQWVEDESGTGDKVLTVFSCPTRYCSDDTAVEFRFRDSLWLDIVYYVTRLQPYDPAEVAGLFLSELNYCSAHAYGTRRKPLDWYPYIFKVECEIIPTQ